MLPGARVRVIAKTAMERSGALYQFRQASMNAVCAAVTAKMHGVWLAHAVLFALSFFNRPRGRRPVRMAEAPLGGIPMKPISCLTTSVSVLALAAVASFSASAIAHPIFLPHKAGIHVAPVMQLNHVAALDDHYVAPKGAKSGTWTDVAGTLPFTSGPWGEMLLTDGTVIVEDYCTNPTQWYRLTPDKKGQYTSGTWSKIATMPSGYSPLFSAQQVLTDGRVVIQGGEYNNCSDSWTTQGAMYDPSKNTWSTITPPSGWTTIGDAESIVLPNGTYMVANCCDSPGQDGQASISGTTFTWTIVNGNACGGEPCNDEEPFAALPTGNKNGQVLQVDVWDHTSSSDETWLFSTSTNKWTQGPNTSCYMSDASSFELGPTASTPNGYVITYGDNPTCNSIYNISTNTFANGPNFGSGYDAADAPAATLPDGNVLVQVSPGVFGTPSAFFETKISKKGKATLTKVNAPKQASGTSSFESNLLVLPTGQVLWDDSQNTPEVAAYTPVGKPKAAWLPVVSSVSNSLNTGSTGNAISGTQFNGFSLGGVYGDDAQAATNFPIVRFTNSSTGDVCYAKSYSFSTMGVNTQGTTTAVFDIPSSCEKGASKLQVVVNGIASTGTSVTLN
jgi:hypothetical protein